MTEIADDIEFITPDGTELTPVEKLAVIQIVDSFLDGDTPAPPTVHRRLAVVREQA